MSEKIKKTEKPTKSNFQLDMRIVQKNRHPVKGRPSLSKILTPVSRDSKTNNDSKTKEMDSESVKIK